MYSMYPVPYFTALCEHAMRASSVVYALLYALYALRKRDVSIVYCVTRERVSQEGMELWRGPPLDDASPLEGGEAGGGR